MNWVALVVEIANHHLEWQNVFNVVCSRWTKHASSGVTHPDLKLVLKSDAIARDIGQT